MKKLLFILLSITGILFFGLGLLWLLQGLGVIYIEPVLCVAQCEQVTGQSVQWQIMGVMLSIFGAALTIFSVKRLPKKHVKQIS